MKRPLHTVLPLVALTGAGTGLAWSTFGAVEAGIVYLLGLWAIVEHCDD